MSESENPPRGRCGMGVLPWLLICATIAYISHLAFSSRSSSQAGRRLWLPVVVETNDVASVLGETRQMEFWTPSVRTKDFLTTNSAGYSDKEQWQVLASDDKVRDFGAALHSNAGVFGYHRVEEWGQGRTGFKPGWWWTMTVGTNYTVVDFARTYRQFWHSPQTVFVEVVDNRGSEDK